MPYANNTYISDKGREMTKMIFHNLFLNDGTNMTLNSSQEIVDHFRGPDGTQFHQTLGIVKQFISGYIQAGYGESYDTGIMICPHCRRRDFMPYWEFVDFGVRNGNFSWTSSVKPAKTIHNVGLNLTAFGYRYTSRVRCNHATTCNDCHTTVTGHYSSCRDCGSSDVSQVGCLREFTHDSVVNEYQASEGQRLNRSRTDVKAVRNIGRGGNLVPDYSLKPFMWRVSYQGPVPQGVVLKSGLEYFHWIPNLEIGYESVSSGMRRPYGYECPDPMCDFERYAPLHGEPYAMPDGSPSDYSESTGKFSNTDSEGNPLSSGFFPSYNQDGKDARGGLVDNMGYCPVHTDLKLVPRIQITDVLSDDCFDSDGQPVNANRTPSKRGYNWGSSSMDKGKAMTMEEVYAQQEVMAYNNQQLARFLNATPMRYPFSSLVRMFVRIPREIFIHCHASGTTDEAYAQYFYSPERGWTLECQRCGRWKPNDRRPARDNDAMETPGLYKIVSSQPLTRPSGGGADGIASLIWPILLSNEMVPDKALRQEQLQMWAGLPIPGKPESGPNTGMSIMLCPNDKQYEAKAAAEVRAKKLAEQAQNIEINDADTLIETVLQNLNGDSPEAGVSMRDYFTEAKRNMDVPQQIVIGRRVQYLPDTADGEFVEITSPHLLKYRPSDEKTDLPGRVWRLRVRQENILMELEDTSELGMTAPGYTYVVCEGRSREGFTHSNGRRYIDVSPECRAFHDRLAPNAATDTEVFYPRWTQTPSWDIRPPVVGEREGTYIINEGDYLWNSENHMAQDRFIVNTYLKTFMPKNPLGEPSLETKYHNFEEIPDPMVSVETGDITIFYQCNTCQDIWNIGNEMEGAGTYEAGAATRQYYLSRGMIDEDGQTTDELYFPQEAYEAALEREGDDISNLGVEDPQLQAMNRGDGRTAKEMLSQPKLVVDPDE